jgi:prepilin-type processing-associated H-X9-DG protein
LQRAGGYDGNAITHGDWSWLKVWDMRGIGDGRPPTDGARAVLCDYAYRDTPAGLSAEPGDNGPAKVMALNGNVLIRGTKPYVRTSPGTPLFKTQKLLGSRALVADTFARSNPGANPRLYPDYYTPVGDGFYAHRDGYNVLYGDWHVRWYGDATQQLMWYPDIYFPGMGMPYDRANYTFTSPWASLSWWWFGTEGTKYVGIGRAWEFNTLPNTNAEEWHTLDVAEGIDTNAN